MPTSLPILGQSDHRYPANLAELEADLLKSLRGQVRFGRHDRLLYSTDASPYQVEPLGVVVPADGADVATAMDLCKQHNVPILPRGGGTSLAGQCTNRCVVIDLSALCRRLISIDIANRACVAEAGLGIDELNRLLSSRAPGLFYAPDPATVAQATIGGCIGNNAAGARSIRYGRTSENVLGVDVVLSGGERLWFEAGAGRRSELALRLAKETIAVVREVERPIRERFAKTIRRNAGYGLDLILKQLDTGVATDDIDLSGLICGSEGTLAVVLAARLKLHSINKAVGLAVASFGNLEEALDVLQAILTTSPTAVELLDDAVLRAALGNPACRLYVDLLPRVGGGNLPRAVLYVEYQGDTNEEIERNFAMLANALPRVAITTFRDAGAMNDAWTLRKSGEALLHGLPGKRKPQTFVEDNAVPVEQLPRFVREFRNIVARHGTEAAYWAHASVGVLHIRPMLDLHEKRDLEHMRQIAIEVADLTRECGGVVSGEHGDGRVRGPLLERYFGSEIVAAFSRIKRIFDPAGILNPGIIVDPGPIESITENLRTHVVPENDGAVKRPVETYFDYSDQDDFLHAVERCNGAGFCRKTSGGTMCPSYRATLDERHSTRGRGNALREAIRGKIGNGLPVWNDSDTLATLDLCLSCKACKSECPSNVDISRLKAEYLAKRWDSQGGSPLKVRSLAHVRRLNQLASVAPAFANFVGNTWPTGPILKRIMGISPKRSLPHFGPSLFRWFNRRPRQASPAKRCVILYADCFTTYNETHIGQAAVEVLERLGYHVRLPKVACCGRPMISMGLLTSAIASADEAIAAISAELDDLVAAIVVCEPSCLSSIKDDWLQLKLRTPFAERKMLADKSFLVEDFVEKFWDEHPNVPQIAPNPFSVLLHGHCHQKALWGDETSAKILRRLTGNLKVVPSGCCGMAGSFGYAAEKYDLSMKIGELSVFGPIRSSDPSTIICAPGTSCRHQIRDGTGRKAVHPIELVAKLPAIAYRRLNLTRAESLAKS